MGELASVTTTGVSPNFAKKMLFMITPATADSSDTIDASDNDVTGGEILTSIDFVTAYDQDSSDIVTASADAAVIRIDHNGGTTDHTYGVLVIGDA